MKIALIKDNKIYSYVVTENPEKEMAFYECDSYKEVNDFVVVDSDGFLVERFYSVSEKPLNAISSFPPDELIKPKWNGEKWIEGKTQEEIDSENQKKQEDELIQLELQRIACENLGLTDRLTIVSSKIESVSSIKQ